MRILGIDPGYGITGFGLVEANRGVQVLLRCGAITTPAHTDFSARLEMIYNDMQELLKMARPDAVAIEELLFGQNVTTGCGRLRQRQQASSNGYDQAASASGDHAQAR